MWRWRAKSQASIDTRLLDDARGPAIDRGGPRRAIFARATYLFLLYESAPLLSLSFFPSLTVARAPMMLDDMTQQRVSRLSRHIRQRHVWNVWKVSRQRWRGGGGGITCVSSTMWVIYLIEITRHMWEDTEYSWTLDFEKGHNMYRVFL